MTTNVMSKKISYYLLYLGILIIFASCGDDESDTAKSISIISISHNGSNLADGSENVQVDGSFELVFDAALDPEDFENQFSLFSENGLIDYALTYENASSKVIVNTTNSLEFNTQYSILIESGPIGQNGQRLSLPYVISFTTMENNVITEISPCTSATSDCLQQISIDDGAENSGLFSFYSNYPVYNQMARWEKLKYAIIAIHGINRNANDYFSYLTTTLQDQDLSNSTVLISPFFKNSSEAESGELFWDNGWRDGEVSKNTEVSISSFTTIDNILTHLADKTYFPVLEKVIITGHSSGALLTHLYAGANVSESLYPELSIEYVVANSQYFYYPVDLRYNENTMAFYEPSDCAVYNNWPLGYVNPPAYLNNAERSAFNDQFINRNITYLLGNVTAGDGSLNTTDCEATLLGETRFSRGENIFRLMETEYSGTHHHQKVIVEGVGHDGQAMYQSPEFKDLLANLLQ